MLLDTGSGAIITTLKDKDASCDDAKCTSPPRFDPNLSKTFQNISGPFTCKFACARVSGKVGEDSIRFLDVSAGNTAFGMVKHAYGDTYWMSRVSGILGLGLESFIEHRKLRKAPIVSLYNERVLDKDVISLSFPEGRQPTAVLGEIPQTKIQWHRIYPPDMEYWSVQLSGVMIGDLAVLTFDRMTIVDSGTDLIWLPDDLAPQIYSK
ncbi:Vacuolar protease A, partial [Tulasnella sp. 403]